MNNSVTICCVQCVMQRKRSSHSVSTFSVSTKQQLALTGTLQRAIATQRRHSSATSKKRRRPTEMNWSDAPSYLKEVGNKINRLFAYKYYFFKSAWHCSRGVWSRSLVWRRLRLRALSVSSGLLCNFVAVYLTFVHFISQPMNQNSVCTLLCNFY